MWGGTDEAESISTIRTALKHGVNVIDTAPVYGFGRSEEIVGKAIAEWRLRSRVLIATKAGLECQQGRVFRNASRARILREIEDSLRRLRTDHIDIYQVHWPDPLVTIEETAEAMHTLFIQGKIRAIGVSNFSVGQMDRFRRVAPLHVLQSPYNLFERGVEADLLPYCRKNKIATLGYGALCRGLLSGRMRPDTTFDGDDLRRGDPKFLAPRFGEYLAAVQQLDRNHQGPDGGCGGGDQEWRCGQVCGGLCAAYGNLQRLPPKHRTQRRGQTGSESVVISGSGLWAAEALRLGCRGYPVRISVGCARFPDPESTRRIGTAFDDGVWLRPWSGTSA
jgi:aryl-alcohol dehydrogenase-like predicted oxidoreductase